jgi:SAM-dependent methyltransferase
LQEDVTNFTVPRQFDIAFSHQVFEHIAPADIGTHLRSVHSALKQGGKFIVCLPNRHWGPQDITRILDNTFRGRIPAQGSHLNESSYLEMVPLLEEHGFSNARTVIPFGAFLPGARGIRVRPRINQFLERSKTARAINNLVARNGRPIFKNPIMLVCEKR